MQTTEFSFDPEYWNLLDIAALRNFEDFMRAEGEVISREHSSQVLRLTLTMSVGHRTFYLKKTLKEKPRHALQMILRGLKPHVDAYREMQGIRVLRKKGFSAMKAVAWGEQRFFGLPLRGFLLSEQVAGHDAQSLFDTGNPATRTSVLQALGNLHGQLNAAGFYQAMRFKDVFLKRSSENEPFQTTLIDRSALWVWPKKMLPHFHCRISLSRSARRLKKNNVRLTPEELKVYAEAYVQAVSGRWKTTTEHIANLLSQSLKTEAGNRPRTL